MKDSRLKSGNFFSEKVKKISTSWPLLVIFVTALIFFYPVWLQKKVPLPADALVAAHVPWTELKWEEYPAGVPVKNQEITDSFSQFYPWRSVVGEFWRSGKAPLWNPYMFSGTPFLATWHSASLYPLNFLYLLFSDLNSWTLLLFLQIFLSGIFMFIFLRGLNLTKPASFLGAISFTFSGYMIAWLEFATGPHAGLWLPLLLLVEVKLIKTHKNVWFIPIPFIFFFIYTAGDFQVPFYITLLFIFFGLFLLYHGKDSVTGFLKLVAGLILGILLSLPQLLPTVELFSHSVRVDDPYIKEYFYGIMHWEKSANFIWPDFFGNVTTGNYWGKFGFHEYLAFVGVIPFVYAISSIFMKKNRSEKFFWWSLIVSLLFLFPTPLAYLPYILKIPGLGTSSASRIIFLVDFLLATLAAFGFSKWQKNNTQLNKTIIGYFAVLVGVGLGIIISLKFISGSQTNNLPMMNANLKVALRNMIPSTASVALLSVLVFAYSKLKRIITANLIISGILFISVLEMLRFGWKNTPFSPKKFVFPQTKILEFLDNDDTPYRIAGGIPLNLFMFFRLESAEGYDPIYPLQNSEWFSLVNSSGYNALSGRYGQIHNFNSTLIDFANVKYVIDYKKESYGGISDKGVYDSSITSTKYKDVYQEGRVNVFENLKALPRVWLGTNYLVEKDKIKSAQIILDQASYDDKLIVLEDEPDLVIKNNEILYSVRDFTREFNSINFDIDTSANALVFLSESYFPGWKAYVDGSEVKIMRANYIFQSISVPEGKHKVTFIYDPKSFRMGVLISSTAFVFLALYAFKYARNIRSINAKN